MVKLSFPYTKSKAATRKDAIHIYPTIFGEDNALHLFYLIDLNGGAVKEKAQIGALVPKDKPEKGVLSFGGKTYHLAESSKLANYNIYIERFPKHRRKNGIAAMLANDEDVCGEAIVVRAKSKWWWRQVKALDPEDFLRDLTRLDPNLKALPDVKPTMTKVVLSSPKFNSTGDLLNKIGRSKSAH